MTLAQLNNVVDQLKSTSSLTGKQKILDANKYDGLLRKVLQFVYDPSITTGISNKKLDKWVAPVKMAGDSPTTIFSNLLDYLKEHNTGRDCDVGLCQYAIEQAGQYGQMVRDVVTKSLTVGCQAKMLNKVYGDDFIPKWEVQQAYPIDTAKLKRGEWFSLSEKLNGIRGTYYKGRIISRQGQEITGLDHIIKAIQDAGYGYYVLDGELRRRTRRKLIINRLAVFVRRNRHLVIVPFVAAAFRTNKRLVHQLPPERLVAVHKFHLAESRKNQIFLYLFDFTERSNCFADHIIAHDGDTVVGAAYAVVEVLLAAEVGAPVGKKLCVAAEVGAPVGKKLCVSQLHLLPDRLALRLRIVQGDFRQDFFLARL